MITQGVASASVASTIVMAFSLPGLGLGLGLAAAPGDAEAFAAGDAELAGLVAAGFGVLEAAGALGAPPEQAARIRRAGTIESDTARRDHDGPAGRRVRRRRVATANMRTPEHC
jgi:hypothetical protein